MLSDGQTTDGATTYPTTYFLRSMYFDGRRKKLYILAAREDTHSRNMTVSLGQMIVRDYKRIVDVVVHRYVKKLKT